MRTLALIVTAFLAIAPAACNTAAFTKANSAAASMTSSTESLDRLRQATLDAKAAYDAMLAQGGDLKTLYKGFGSSIDKYTSSIDGVKRAIEGVEKSAASYLEAYAQTRDTIKNPDLRAAMLIRKESVERQLADMKLELDRLYKATDAYTHELVDLRAFFSASLNEQNIGPAAAVHETLDRAISEIALSADRVSLTLKEIASSLTTERPS